MFFPAAMDFDDVVLTPVTRDDLPDGGASHFTRTILAIKTQRPTPLCEAPRVRAGHFSRSALVVSGAPEPLVSR
jgi:lipoate synthase